MRIRGFFEDRVERGKTAQKKLGNNIISKPPVLKKLSSSDCSTCDLWGSKATVGKGDKEKAEWVFVGDYPDDDGVGKGSEILQQLFDGLGYDMEKVYIMNVVRCKPRHGGLKPEVIKCCSGNVEMELSTLLNKKLIVAMGVVASEWFMKSGNMYKDRGYIYDTKWGKVMQTFHPSYWNIVEKDLMGRDGLDFMVADLKRAKVFVETGKSSKSMEGKYRIVHTEADVEQMKNDFSSNDIVGIDFEATELDMYSPTIELMSVALSKGKEYVWCVPFKFIQDEQVTISAKQAVKEIYNKTNVVMFNAAYDQLVGSRLLGWELKPVDDAMIMWYVLNGGRSKGGMKLKRLVMDYTDGGDYGVDYETLMGLAEQDLVEYNCADALYTVELVEKFGEKLDSGMWNAYNNVLKIAYPVLLEMRDNGIKVDLDYTIQLEKMLNEKLKSLVDKMSKVIGKSINLNSPKQVIECLRSRGIEVVSSDKSILSQYMGKDEFIDILLEYREIETTYSRYVVPFITTHTKADGLVHAQFSLTNSATGRVASSDPNLQNIPVRMGPIVERMFISRWDDGYIVKADYGQHELRTVAMYSQDRKMQEFFNSGVDIHNKVAIDIYGFSEDEMMAGTKAAKEARRVAKGFNFGVIYGRGATSIAKELGIEVQEAEEIRKKYFELFSDLWKWIQLTQEVAIKNKYIRTMFGRIRYLDGLKSNDRALQGGALREALNTPVQSAASDIGLLGMKACVDEFKKRKLKVKCVDYIHDAMLFDTPGNELEEVINIIKEKAINMELPIWQEYGEIRLDVPLAVSISYGRNWGECK